MQAESYTIGTLTCSRYSEKSYIVRGDTKTHKDKLKELKGRYIANSKDGNGPGWIFALSRLESLLQAFEVPTLGVNLSLQTCQFQETILLPAIGTSFIAANGNEYTMKGIHETLPCLILQDKEENAYTAYYIPIYNTWFVADGFGIVHQK